MVWQPATFWHVPFTSYPDMEVMMLFYEAAKLSVTFFGQFCVGSFTLCSAEEILIIVMAEK